MNISKQKRVELGAWAGIVTPVFFVAVFTVAGLLRPGYEPLARGMAAALPYVDHFLTGHSIGSLEQLADILEKELT